MGIRCAQEIIRSRPERTFIFGVVYPFSSHNFLLRDWLTAAGIHPDRDVRIVGRAAAANGGEPQGRDISTAFARENRGTRWRCNRASAGAPP